ncbi:hypothetical protein CDO87_03535 [Sagittula sp. P11]|nr:hypothetical protein CDO87_03535 [Sagittula sp. P11]
MPPNGDVPGGGQPANAREEEKRDMPTGNSLCRHVRQIAAADSTEMISPKRASIDDPIHLEVGGSINQVLRS